MTVSLNIKQKYCELFPFSAAEQYHFLCHSVHGLSHRHRARDEEKFPVMFLLASADGFPQPLHCYVGRLALRVRVNNSCQ